MISNLPASTGIARAAGLIVALLGTAAPSLAQLVVHDLGTRTIDLDGNQPGICRFVPPVTAIDMVSIAEPGGWAAQGEDGRFSFLSGGVTGAWPGSPALATPFTADANDDGDDTDRFDNYQAGIVASPAGGAGDYALRFAPDTWADKGYIFKVDNATGGTVASWTLGLDSWFNDAGLSVATLRLGYATAFSDFTNVGGALEFGAGFTEVASRTGTNSNAGLSALANIGASFSAPLADGGSLYVAVLYDQDGQGTEFIVDNLAVTASSAPPPPLGITTLSLAEATRGTAYSEALAATGGSAPLQWSITAGSLPSGLTMDAGGLISGTPDGLGASTFTVTITDSLAASDSRLLTLTVNAEPIPQPGSPLLYEPFDYAAGPIDGAAGGSGWGADPWDAQNDIYFPVWTPGLSYDGLEETGGSVAGGGAYTACGRSFGLLQAWDGGYATQPLAYFVKQSMLGGEYDVSVLGRSGTSLWLGALVMRSGTPGAADNPAFLSLVPASIPWLATDQVGLYLKQNSGVWEWQVGRDASQVSSGIEAVEGEVAFVVMRYDFGADEDSVILYVNPTAGVAAPDVTGVTFTAQPGDPDMAFRSLYCYFGNGEDMGELDEVRIGTTFAAVASGGSAAGGFESWAAANNVTGGQHGDSDNDGIGNLLEYALLTDLNGPDGALGDFDGTTLSFAKRSEAVANGDVSYLIEASTTMGVAPDPWQAVVPTVDDGSGISYQFPNGPVKNFARLRVELP